MGNGENTTGRGCKMLKRIILDGVIYTTIIIFEPVRILTGLIINTENKIKKKRLDKINNV